MLIDTSPPDHRDIPLELDAQVARGSYCNVAFVSHTAWEFVLDFAFVGPNQPRGLVVSRIIMHPSQAEALHRALGDNLQRFAASGEDAPTRT